MRKGTTTTVIGFVLHHLTVVAGSIGLALLCFLVLPLIQAITEPPRADTLLRTADGAAVDPPPPPPEPPPPEEEPEEEPPPELEPEVQQLDLSQLELALDAGFADGFGSIDMGVHLENVIGSGADVDALFSLADLDQTPRLIYSPPPAYTAKLRRKAPGTVNLLFIVDERGRVESPKVHSSSDPVFEKAALKAIKKWKFEPGKRQGKPVRFRMKLPMTFPKG